MKKIALVFLSLFSMVLPSLLFSTPVIARSGFYVELALGSTQSSGDLSTSSTITNLDNELIVQPYTDSENLSGDSLSAALKLGYQFNDYFAAELGKNKGGGWEGSGMDELGNFVDKSVETTSLTTGIKALVPIFEDFSVFTRLGVANWDLKVTSKDYSLNNELVLIEGDGYDLYYSIGAEYLITENYSIGIEYSATEMNLAESVTKKYQSSNSLSKTSVNYKLESISLLFKMTF